MLLLAVDDTDSREGGCTTSLVHGLHSLFSELTPAGPARLVRLNPNIPWKTRGNAAVSMAFSGHLDLDEALARVVAFLETHAQQAEGTSPGCVVSHQHPHSTFYKAAVQRVVARDEADAALKAVGARSWGGRGVIGATAALAWPAERTSWERIAYRAPDLVGTPRAVEPARVRDIEHAFPTLFDSYDLVEEDVVCVPASPCPVLWGLRGDDPHELALAAGTLGPEQPAWETLFLTNQASDDHLIDRTVAQARAFESARVRGRVVERPREHGGHVFIEIEDATGRLRAAAYAPTRGFRRVVLALRAGDDVTVAGGLHEGPDARLTLGLEKMRLHEAAPRKVANPRCPACNAAMKSAGRSAGWRCRACRTHATHAVTAAAPLVLGWHEVPACARRHLAAPLKRLALHPAWMA